MSKFLDSEGISYLWGRVKSTFATKTEVSTKVESSDFDDLTDEHLIDNNTLSNSEIDEIVDNFEENYVHSAPIVNNLFNIYGGEGDV